MQGGLPLVHAWNWLLFVRRAAHASPAAKFEVEVRTPGVRVAVSCAGGSRGIYIAVQLVA